MRMNLLKGVNVKETVKLSLAGAAGLIVANKLREMIGARMANGQLIGSAIAAIAMPLVVQKATKNKTMALAASVGPAIALLLDVLRATKLDVAETVSQLISLNGPDDVVIPIRNRQQLLEVAKVLNGGNSNPLAGNLQYTVAGPNDNPLSGNGRQMYAVN